MRDRCALLSLPLYTWQSSVPTPTTNRTRNDKCTCPTNNYARISNKHTGTTKCSCTNEYTHAANNWASKPNNYVSR